MNFIAAGVVQNNFSAGFQLDLYPDFRRIQLGFIPGFPQDSIRIYTRISAGFNKDSNLSINPY
jgi:hypothetical protein